MAPLPHPRRMGDHLDDLWSKDLPDRAGGADDAGETVGRDELSTSSHTIRSTPDPLSSVAQVSDPEGDKRAETGDESPSSPGGASVNAPQCWGEQIRNAFPDIQGAESARCVHGFIRGKGHLKNKFCTRCREGFDVPASQCRALAPGELSAVFRNYSGVGLWARTPPQYGEKRFRLVNQTKQCRGQRIAIFVEKPPDIESEPIPSAWISSTPECSTPVIRFVIACGTLVPAAAITRAFGLQQHEIQQRAKEKMAQCRGHGGVAQRIIRGIAGADSRHTTCGHVASASSVARRCSSDGGSAAARGIRSTGGGGARTTAVTGLFRASPPVRAPNRPGCSDLLHPSMHKEPALLRTTAASRHPSPPPFLWTRHNPPQRDRPVSHPKAVGTHRARSCRSLPRMLPACPSWPPRRLCTPCLVMRPRRRPSPPPPFPPRSRHRVSLPMVSSVSSR